MEELFLGCLIKLGTAQSCVRGDSVWVLGTGSGHSPKLLAFK